MYFLIYHDSFAVPIQRVQQETKAACQKDIRNLSFKEASESTL